MMGSFYAHDPSATARRPLHINSRLRAVALRWHPASSSLFSFPSRQPTSFHAPALSALWNWPSFVMIFYLPIYYLYLLQPNNAHDRDLWSGFMSSRVLMPAGSSTPASSAGVTKAMVFKGWTPLVLAAVAVGSLLHVWTAWPIGARPLSAESPCSCASTCRW